MGNRCFPYNDVGHVLGVPIIPRHNGSVTIRSAEYRKTDAHRRQVGVKFGRDRQDTYHRYDRHGEKVPSMDSTIRIFAGGNTLAPALSELVGLGFSVSRMSTTVPSESAFRAVKAGVILEAPDTVSLLGLAFLAQRRGAKWEPNNEEVAGLLRLEGISKPQAGS